MIRFWLKGQKNSEDSTPPCHDMHYAVREMFFSLDWESLGFDWEVLVFFAQRVDPIEKRFLNGGLLVFPFFEPLKSILL